MAWSRAFDDPIPLPDGRVLKTLYDAGHYAIALPKAVQERVGWRIAAEMLIAAAQGQRPVIFAEIATRRDGGDETLTDVARSYNVSHSTIGSRASYWERRP